MPQQKRQPGTRPTPLSVPLLSGPEPAGPRIIWAPIPLCRDGQDGLYVPGLGPPRQAGRPSWGILTAGTPRATPWSSWRGASGRLFIPGLERYDTYKYAVHTADGRVLAKADPYAFHAETRPGTASKLYDLAGYQWGDGGWLDYRRPNPVYDQAP